MKYKVTRDEVFRLWARKAQDHAEELSGGRTYFSGDTCYSYGSHFPIAKHIGDGNVLFTLQTYSNTTAKHISDARHACFRANLNVIYCYSIESVRDSIKHWEDEMEELFSQISNPKNRKFENRVEKLKCIAKQFRKYMEIFTAHPISFKTATALALIDSGNVVAKLREPDREFKPIAKA